MSKERLEEINQRILDMKRKSGMPTEVLTWEGWQSVLPIFTKDLEYLYERIQELETHVETATYIQRELRRQNKHYREVIKTIEKYANDCTDTEVEMNPYLVIDDIKALESESE